MHIVPASEQYQSEGSQKGGKVCVLTAFAITRSSCNMTIKGA